MQNWKDFKTTGSVGPKGDIFAFLREVIADNKFFMVISISIFVQILNKKTLLYWMLVNIHLSRQNA